MPKFKVGDKLTHTCWMDPKDSLYQPDYYYLIEEVNRDSYTRRGFGESKRLPHGPYDWRFEYIDNDRTHGGEFYVMINPDEDYDENDYSENDI